MIEIVEEPISPELVINKVKTDDSGCVVAYIGLIRKYSRGKSILSVEYNDSSGTAEGRLQEIASEITRKWQVNNLAISHRIGKLNVGDISIVFAVASGHRQEGIAACQYAVDRFKQIKPTQKKETYQDGSIWVEG